MRASFPVRMPSWARRHRALAGDVALILLLAVGIFRAEDPPGTAGQWWAVGVVAVAMLLRRHHPEPTLAVTTLTVVVTMVVSWPPSGGLLVLLGALTYSAALHSERRRPWHQAAACWGAVVLAGSLLHFSDWWSSDPFGLLACVFGGAGVGDSIRMRRAYIAEVTERARQAEQTREREARRRVIDERLRIARELHDIVAHHIAVISVHAGAAGHVLRDQPDRVWPVIGHIRQAADTVLDEVKTVIGVLRDPNEVPSTQPVPGLAQLPALLDGLATAGFRVRHQCSGTPRELPAMVDLAAYRIVQEALTNAHKHGDGQATLDIGWSAERLVIEVTNRAGAVPPGSGFGLVGMRERATAAHGTMTAGPLPGGRFRIHATLPTTGFLLPALDGGPR